MSRLGLLLVNEGILSASDRQLIKRESANHHGSFARSILALGLLDEVELSALFASKTSYRQAQKDILQELDLGIINVAPLHVLSWLEVLPLHLKDGALVLAMVDPTDLDAISQMAFFTGYQIRPVIATQSQIVAGLKEVGAVVKIADSRFESFIKTHGRMSQTKQKSVKPKLSKMTDESASEFVFDGNDFGEDPAEGAGVTEAKNVQEMSESGSEEFSAVGDEGDEFSDAPSSAVTAAKAVSPSTNAIDAALPDEDFSALDDTLDFDLDEDGNEVAKVAAAPAEENDKTRDAFSVAELPVDDIASDIEGDIGGGLEGDIGGGLEGDIGGGLEGDIGGGLEGDIGGGLEGDIGGGLEGDIGGGLEGDIGGGLEGDIGGGLEGDIGGGLEGDIGGGLEGDIGGGLEGDIGGGLEGDIGGGLEGDIGGGLEGDIGGGLEGDIGGGLEGDIGGLDGAIAASAELSDDVDLDADPNMSAGGAVGALPDELDDDVDLGLQGGLEPENSLDAMAGFDDETPAIDLAGGSEKLAIDGDDVLGGTEDLALDGASLDGASLDGASLDGASLDGASLDDLGLDGPSELAATESLEASGEDLGSLEELSTTALDNAFEPDEPSIDGRELEASSDQPGIEDEMNVEGNDPSFDFSDVGEDVSASTLPGLDSEPAEIQEDSPRAPAASISPTEKPSGVAAHAGISVLNRALVQMQMTSDPEKSLKRIAEVSAKVGINSGAVVSIKGGKLVKGILWQQAAGGPKSEPKIPAGIDLKSVKFFAEKTAEEAIWTPIAEALGASAAAIKKSWPDEKNAPTMVLSRTHGETIVLSFASFSGASDHEGLKQSFADVIKSVSPKL